MRKPKEQYNLKRVRDGRVIPFDAAHALNLLRLNATFAKSEWELEEKHYSFKDNEIYRNPNNTATKSAEVQG